MKKQTKLEGLTGRHFTFFNDLQNDEILDDRVSSRLVQEILSTFDDQNEVVGFVTYHEGYVIILRTDFKFAVTRGRFVLESFDTLYAAERWMMLPAERELQRNFKEIERNKKLNLMEKAAEAGAKIMEANPQPNPTSKNSAIVTAMRGVVKRSEIVAIHGSDRLIYVRYDEKTGLTVTGINYMQGMDAYAYKSLVAGGYDTELTEFFLTTERLGMNKSLLLIERIDSAIWLKVGLEELGIRKTNIVC